MDNQVLEKPVKNTLLMMAAPAMIGMLLTFLFQLVDTYFVAKIGTDKLAAVGFSYPVYIFIVSVFMGFSSGVASVVANRLGAGKEGEASNASFVALLFILLFSIAISTAGYFSIDAVFTLLGAKENMLSDIAAYMKPLYLGMFLLGLTLIANATLMAKGLMFRSTLIMAIGGLVNLVLDYLLIFGFWKIEAMGLKGAAYATVGSWIIAAFLMLLLSYKEGLIGIRKDKNAQFISLLGDTLKISLPALLAQTLNPVAIAVITRFVSTYGTDQIAAYSVATRIESLALTGILALSVIVTPVTASSHGAKAKSRLDEVVALSGRMTVYWGIAVALLLTLFSTQIAEIFTSDKAVVEAVSVYFMIVAFSYPFHGLNLITSSYLNGVFEIGSSLKLTIVKTLVLTIPFTIFASYYSIDFIWMAIALANILGAAYAGKLIFSWQRKTGSSL